MNEKNFIDGTFAATTENFLLYVGWDFTSTLLLTF